LASPAQQKTLGAFYTDEAVARFLVNWALRTKTDSVLDPSCGDGVFLGASMERLRALGSQKPEVWGVDVDPKAVGAARVRGHTDRLFVRDFFSLKPGDVRPVTAIVGNPPFIRYQTFNGSSRDSALTRAREAGVHLPKLSSSWAPFLVHAAAFLQRGGRLAMVVPAELAHAQYAREVLRFLFRKFGWITVRLFQNKLFPELSQDTFLLLCEDYGKACDWCSVVSANNIDQVERDEGCAIPVDIEAIRTGRRRLTHYLLPSKARHLYEAMSEQAGVVRLWEAADVGIGYVTGANAYFHLSLAESRKWGIPSRYLAAAALSLGNSQGIALQRADWDRLARFGKKVFLLTLPESRINQFPRSVLEYLAYGKRHKVPSRFKCRVRRTWYSIPHVRVGDALLSYMSGLAPKLVGNPARLVAPNTLHVVRFKEGWKSSHFVAGWYSSLTRLSCELEGHPLGGGMLKLEPSEAERVLIALPCSKDSHSLLRDLDPLLRQGQSVAALDVVDSRVLRRRFGLSGTECITLREAAKHLETWRMHK